MGEYIPPREENDLYILVTGANRYVIQEWPRNFDFEARQKTYLIANSFSAAGSAFRYAVALQTNSSLRALPMKPLLLYSQLAVLERPRTLEIN